MELMRGEERRSSGPESGCRNTPLNAAESLAEDKGQSIKRVMKAVDGVRRRSGYRGRRGERR